MVPLGLSGIVPPEVYACSRNSLREINYCAASVMRYCPPGIYACARRFSREYNYTVAMVILY